MLVRYLRHRHTKVRILRWQMSDFNELGDIVLQVKADYSFEIIALYY